MTFKTVRRIVMLAVAVAGVALATAAAAGVREWTPIGPTTTHVYDVAIDPQTPSTVFATTENGLFRSRDGGDTWERVLEDPAPYWGEIFVEVDPQDPRTVYLAGSFSFAKSVDGGDTWTVSGIDGGVFEECRFQGLTVAPQGTVLYAVGRYFIRRCGGVILKSDDAGVSWTRVFQYFQPLSDPYSVAVDPSQSLNVYAATSTGVWKSTDGAATWSETELRRPAYAVAAGPHLTSVVYAGTDDGVRKSFDGGLSWGLSEGSRMGSPVDVLAVSFRDPDVVYAGTRSTGLYRSDDGGNTWTPIAIRAGRRQVEALALDPHDPAVVYAATNGAGLIKSGDGERIWRELTVTDGTGEPLRAEVLSMTIDPRFASTFYAGTRNEGVYRSDDEGRSWYTVNSGLNADEVTALAFVPDGPGTVYAGTPEGFWVSENAGGSWQRRGGLGAVRSLAVDPYTPGRVYAITDQGLFESRDSGNRWTILFGSERSVAFAAAWDASSPVFYLALPDAVYQSSDRGGTWNPGAQGLAGRILYSLAAPPGRSGVVYAATDEGVYKSLDEGRTWFLSVPCDGFCHGAELVLDPREPSHVYARQDGLLYESLDAGLSWEWVPTWPADRGSLTPHPWSPSTVYLGGYELINPRCDETALCFDRQRFAVELVWRDRGGRTGLGRTAPATSDDSGVMWFFGESNWEVLVKVLDGCRVNDRFWVFAAATTDVEYGLRVTDSLSGSVKSYFNPVGNRAAALTDTSAFATCF